MIVDYHGTKQSEGRITQLVAFLENADDLSRWLYCGLTVEIDPTADYEFQNILVRWVDINEGFNDRIIVETFEEFNSLFTKIS